jgi:hypothetical protein
MNNIEPEEDLRLSLVACKHKRTSCDMSKEKRRRNTINNFKTIKE